jgi:hypothetical protein
MDESSSELFPRARFGICVGEPSFSVIYTQQITHFTLPAYSVTFSNLYVICCDAKVVDDASVVTVGSLTGPYG